MNTRRTILLLFAAGALFPAMISALSICCISIDFVEHNNWFITMVRRLWISVDWLLDDVGSGWTWPIALTFLLRSLFNGIYWACAGICAILCSNLIIRIVRQIRG